MATVTSGGSDAVVAAIIGGRLRAVVGDMGATLSNTARSPRISVRHQFGCALLDHECRVAAADNPRYVAALEATTRGCVDAFRFDLADDDIIITNDPYRGSPSAHHFTVVAPVALSRDVKAYVAVIAHMGDVGGWVMGNYDPTARELRTEAVRFSPMKIVKFGRTRRDVVETIYLNSRLGETFEGDLNGQLAALALGRRELVGLTARYDAPTLDGAMQTVMEYGKRRTRSALKRIPEGRYEGEAVFSVEDEDLRVHAAIERSGEETRIDFSGTGSQAERFVNCSPTTTATQALVPLMGLLDDDIPWNSGVLGAVEIVTEPGTLVEPEHPAPSGWSLDHVGVEVSEAVRGALATAIPDRIGPGLPSRDLAFTVRRERRHGSSEEQLAVTDLSVLAQPGSSAGSEIDGWGQPGPEALGQLPSVEEVERETGLVIRAMEFRPDSGGAGARRGGLGVSTTIEFPPDSSEYLYAVVGASSADVTSAAAGAPGSIALVGDDGADELLAGTVVRRPMPGGAVLRIDAGGGRGFGPPGERDRDDVIQDLLTGRVSAAAGRDDYGVELDDDSALTATERGRS